MYKEINKKAGMLRKKYPDLRKGQSLMNTLGEIDPVKCKMLTGTEYDCFYEDSKIPNFIIAVTK